MYRFFLPDMNRPRIIKYLLLPILWVFKYHYGFDPRVCVSRTIIPLSYSMINNRFSYSTLLTSYQWWVHSLFCPNDTIICSGEVYLIYGSGIIIRTPFTRNISTLKNMLLILSCAASPAYLSRARWVDKFWTISWCNYVFTCQICGSQRQ